MSQNIKLNKEEYSSSSDDTSDGDYNEFNEINKPTLDFKIDNEPIDDLDIQYKKLNKKELFR